MKVKIAVTDANIFIDLYNLGLINDFFNLEFEIHTTASVLMELYKEQQEILRAYQSVGKLEIHNLKGEDFIEIFNKGYPKSLSEADKSVLFIASKINACVLSSDKVIRNYAKNQGIEYHGMIWIFDVFVEKTFLTPREAVSKMKQLVDSNFLFRNNRTLDEEIEKRLKKWS